MELKIEYLNVNDLKPYEKNARKHEQEDVETIVNSIKQFGFNDPIGIWGKDNVIVEGHGRLLASKELGMDKVPCIRLDSLTDEQRRAYTLAHNKTAEMSAWDKKILDFELGSILDIDMEDFGFEFPKQEEEEEKPEVEFSEELLEENNYLVLKCDNSVDWLQIETFFNLKTVKTLNSKKGYEQKGVGRVIDATDFFDTLVKKGVIE